MVLPNRAVTSTPLLIIPVSEQTIRQRGSRKRRLRFPNIGNTQLFYLKLIIEVNYNTLQSAISIL